MIDKNIKAKIFRLISRKSDEMCDSSIMLEKDNLDDIVNFVYESISEYVFHIIPPNIFFFPETIDENNVIKYYRLDYNTCQFTDHSYLLSEQMIFALQNANRMNEIDE